MRIRNAKPRDKGLFRKLWKEYMADQEKKGSLYKNSKDNLNTYTKIFDLYVSGEAEGIVLFVAQDAVVMWGDMFSPFEFIGGKPAMGWGTYVVPDKRKSGISVKIREEGLKQLHKMGFEQFIGAIVVGNEEGMATSPRFNWEQKMITGTVDIESMDFIKEKG